MSMPASAVMCSTSIESLKFSKAAICPAPPAWSEGKTVTCSKPRSLATFRSTTSAQLRCSQPWTAKWSWCFRKILTTVETIAQAI